MKKTILEFLRELAAAQDKAISVLKRKQQLLIKPNKAELDKMAVEENAVLADLHQVIQRREDILQQGLTQGVRADSIQLLCEKLLPNDFECQKQIIAASQRSRQLRYLATTNWTMSQRSMIHLAQMLELIETKGQGKVAYGSKSLQNTGQTPSASSGGGFVDRTA